MTSENHDEMPRKTDAPEKVMKANAYAAQHGVAAARVRASALGAAQRRKSAR